VIQTLRHRLLGRAASAAAAGEIPPDAGEVLVVLGEQDGEHPIRRDQSDEAAVGVDHGEAGLRPPTHRPGGVFLVHPGLDDRRVGVHHGVNPGRRVSC
jgi:hypothetical protein